MQLKSIKLVTRPFELGLFSYIERKKAQKTRRKCAYRHKDIIRLEDKSEDRRMVTDPLS